MKRRRSKAPVQYTLRSISPDVDEALRRIAAETGRSLNDVAKEALSKGAGVGALPTEFADLDGFFGTWVEDPEVERCLAEQRRVDPELWR